MTRNSSGVLRRALRWLPILALVAISLGVLISGAPHLLSLDRLLSYRATLMEAVAADRSRAIGVACLVYIGCVIVSVPASLVLTILSGFLFGAATGAGIALVSATTGAAIVFSIGRGPMSEFLVTRAGPRLGRLAAGFRDDAFGFILVLRLLPIFPFWMTNLAPAAFGVPLRTFVLATFLGLAPGAVVYAAAGSAIEDVVAANEAAKADCLASGAEACDEALSLRSLVTVKTLAGLGGLAAFALLSIGLRRRFARKRSVTSQIPVAGQSTARRPERNRDVNQSH
ncbi:TVP38/TMEM64 family protein [Methylobacterium sp. Leaf106]|uniref:TVP38/TMEM64 family protein n=1 Tax=Methylobacterium sp. Leaf106 TaxID=1736255 RepID=UPI0006FF728E|nr:VTT domain-containing protein [Methylobacterium sp. Leaf106]KQP40502.1 SNARE associated Golgi family protein [Methylobacterium sp. Leaf106]